MTKKRKILAVCIIVGLFATGMASLFVSPTVSIVIGFGAGIWLALLANDWCPGVWFLRWVGILPVKK